MKSINSDSPLAGLLTKSVAFRFLFLLRKIFFTRATRKYFSQYGEDIVYDRVINLKREGFFVDVGCYHPTKYNNTYKLYKRGWRGINIDLDDIKIQAFNLRRPGDINVLCAVSDEEAAVPLYASGFYSLTQTLDPESAMKTAGAGLTPKVRHVQTKTLTSIIDQTRYKDCKIDLLSVDVEGFELKVLKSLDFERFQPKIVVVESQARALNQVLNSEVYRYLTARGYDLFNWTGPSLLFIHPRKI